MAIRSIPKTSVLLLLLAIAVAVSAASLVGSDDLVLPRRGGGGFIPGILRIPSENLEAAGECEQTYGVLPCTTTAIGNLFLLLVYGFLMLQAAKLISAGSEMLLEILGPGIVGGLFLPILGALPDAILIFVSGISGSKETAQKQVLIGMGLLAGSTVMLLTLLWGSCIVIGKCDLSEDSGSTIDSQDTRGFNLTGSGVSTDVETSRAAKIMIISVIPFIIAQIPSILKSHAADRLAVLVALILAVVFLLSYCVYQIVQPWNQKRQLERVKLKQVMSGMLKSAYKQALGKLLNGDGSPNKQIIKSLFEKLDCDKDGHVDSKELRALFVGIDFEEIDIDATAATEKVMEEFDTSRDNKIDRDEFVEGMCNWLKIAMDLVPRSSGSHTIVLRNFHDRAREEGAGLIDRSEDDTKNVENPTWTCFTAVLLLIAGTIVAVAFADPFIDAVSNFSVATRIPSFFISFVAMPLATNSSEAVSSLIFASRKTQKTSSLTFSQIYGAVTMNNTLCLAVFLALVYTRGLMWDFSSEVLVILLVCIIMGLFTSFRTTFPLWTCCFAYLLYPLSLALVYILDFVFGWS